MSGLTRLAFNPLTNSAFGPEDYSTFATTHSGARVLVDVNDYHGRILYLFGTNDPKVQTLCRELLDVGDVFLDIGANYSSIGLNASRKVGATGRVHLFEPQACIAERVQNGIADAHFDNVTMHQLALSDCDGTFTLKVPPGHSGMATLVGDRDQAGWKTIDVNVRDIAGYVAPLVAGKRFGVKLDVEGGELQVLPWLVRQSNLKFLVFEAAHNHGALFEQITQAGLTMFGLRRRLFRKQVERVGSLDDLRKFHDLVAVRVADTPHVLKMHDLRRFVC